LEDSIQTTEYDGKPVNNLDVLVTGPKPPNPAELLDSKAMARLLEEVRKNYDRVLIDTPPVLFVADASILAGICDGVIVVVKSYKNSASITNKVRKHLEGVKARVLGGVINNVFVSRLGYYYSHYYYYYPYYRYYRDYDRAYYPSQEEISGQKSKGAT
jgi:capsular exopolysaccharide synthesis family protein